MTFKELGDDATSDIEAFVTFTNLTTSNIVRAISESLHEMQLQTKVLEKTLTIAGSSLDANGAIALDRSITVPRRGAYSAGGTLSAPCQVRFIGRDVMAQKKLNAQWSHIQPNVIFCSVEQNQLYFFPFQGLTGTFTLSCVAKMPIYVLSAAADATSFWYGWDNAHIDAKYTATLIPQEFEDGLTALTAYVSARLLTFIPGWQRRFGDRYAELMSKFEAAMENIKENLPDYELNYEPKMNYGW
jgi:hypothetical protein